MGTDDFPIKVTIPFSTQLDRVEDEIEKHEKYGKWEGWPDEEIWSRETLFGERWESTLGTFRDNYPGLKPTAKENCAYASHVAGRDGEVAQIENELVKIPDSWMYHVEIESPEKHQTWAHPDLVYRIQLLVDAVFNKYGYFYPIPLFSAYRRLGTTVYGATMAGSEIPKDDICGANDATDAFGHWRGKSMDLGTKPWRWLFNMKYVNTEGEQTDAETCLTELDYLLDEVGLFRPWKSSDSTHHTIIQGNKYYKKPKEPYEPGWENSKRT